jgi:hypothetical protein
LAPAAVRHAVTQYDQVRGATVDDINAKNPDAVTSCLSELEARLDVLACISEDLDDINEDLTWY